MSIEHTHVNIEQHKKKEREEKNVDGEKIKAKKRRDLSWPFEQNNFYCVFMGTNSAQRPELGCLA